MNNDYLDLIKKSSLLSTLSQEETKEYVRLGKFRFTEYTKNSVIHFEGEICTRFEIILSGNISIEKIDESGNSLSITNFDRDNILGGNLIFSNHPYYPMTT